MTRLKAHQLLGSCRRDGLRFAETVADPIQRFDHVEVVIDRLELLAKPLDVAVDRAIIDIDLLVISRNPSARHGF